MASYDQYFAGNLQDFSVTEKQIRDSVAELDIFPAE
jgi:hypothetical protein